MAGHLVHCALILMIYSWPHGCDVLLPAGAIGLAELLMVKGVHLDSHLLNATTTIRMLKALAAWGSHGPDKTLVEKFFTCGSRKSAWKDEEVLAMMTYACKQRFQAGTIAQEALAFGRTIEERLVLDLEQNQKYTFYRIGGAGMSAHCML